MALEWGRSRLFAMPYLEITKGKAVVQSPLGDEAMSIGRQPGNSIVINDPDISRQHCVIDRVDGRYRIFDVGSRNGTVVNGRKVQHAELASGDVIVLGKTVAHFRDAPQHKRRSVAIIRHWLVWVPAMSVFLVTAFIAAWATGMLGERFPLWEIRQYLNVGDPQQSRAMNDEDDRGPAVDVTQPPLVSPTDVDPPPQENGPQSGVRTEESTDRLRYEWFTSTTTIEEIEALFGRPVAARFIGKPTRDAGGRLVWELPPDGEITAVLEATSVEEQRVLDVLEREPMLLEAELSGVLRRDRDGSRLILRVGVIVVQRAWGNSDTALHAETQSLLNQRIIINREFAAVERDAGN